MLKPILALVVLASLVGCAGRSISGHVTLGKSSLAMVVDQADERLDDEGVAGVRVRVESGSGTLLGEAISKTDGSFTIEIPNNQSDRVWILSEPEGYLRVKSTVFPPPSGRRVLVVLVPRHSGGR